MNKHRYNLRRNPEFFGERFKIARPRAASSRPASVDLRSKFPACFDQGQEGSCGPNSADAIMCFFHPDIDGFSRQQIYYNVRQIEGTVTEDAGVQTVDLFKVLHTKGASPEWHWPYSEPFQVKPPQSVMQHALGYRLKSYSQLASEEDFLDCLADGFPFVLGISVYESFESDQMAQTGVMIRPNIMAEQLLGGHDVTVVGYDTNFLQNPVFLQSGVDPAKVNNTALLIRNSWGTGWGINGYFYMPVDYASSTQTGGDAWSGRI